jgi:hypothetical protein
MEAIVPDDISKKHVGSAEQIFEYTLRWIRTAESDIEQLAATTGKRQEKTIGMQDDAGTNLLIVNLTCEPRQFATTKLTGVFAEEIKKVL